MDNSMKVFTELPDLFNQIPDLVEAVISHDCISNPVYAMLLSTKMVNVCGGAEVLKKELEGYIDLLKQICKEEGIDIPEYDPDKPREWTAIFKP